MDNKDKVNILGINITKVSRVKALNQIQEFLSGEKQYYVVTPNPEIILLATGRKHDEELFYILNRADIALADGVALKFAGWLMGKNITRITGADLLIILLEIAEAKNYKVAIYNWNRGLSSANDINKALKEKFPKLKVYAENIERDEAIDFTAVNQFKPQMVFCSLGAPFQEKFVYYNLAKIPSAKIGMSVGGSFDYLTGKVRRAPKIIRSIGLEWLWRLIKQPHRIGRIWSATAVFPYRFLKWRFILPLLYRPNVACLVYKKEKSKYKILVVERLENKGHWQLPQGGTDGESLRQAGSRELREEINTASFKAGPVYKNLHKYGYKGNLSELKKNRYGYKGQKQSLLIAEFTGQDSDIKVNFWEHRGWQWVDAENFLEIISPVRREAGKIYLEKFSKVVGKNFKF